jgi:hypothetical protein
MRRISERKGVWRKLHNEALYALHPSSNVIQVIKSRIMRWAGNMARYGGQETCMQCFVGRPDRIHLEDERMDGSIILKWLFKKWDEEA